MTSKIRYMFSILMILFYLQINAQDIFEEAVSGKSQEEIESESKKYELNGFLRGVLFGGKVPDEDEAEMKSGYGEASLRFSVSKNNITGDGFAEIRLRKGNEFNEYILEYNLREAFVNIYLGRFDFKFGHQIVVWGRADGFNPTNNITPQNMLVRSPDEDDRREGNFLIRSFCNVYPLRFEAIWVPSYSASALPTKYVSLPPGITLAEPDYPDVNLKNGACAIRLNIEMSSIDGSVSYFNGYNPLPGVHSEKEGEVVNLIPKAYRMHVVGADFSTTVGSFGLRGEFAYRKPYKDYKKYINVPNPDLQYIIGVDKEFGSFSLILQYLGKYVFDFSFLTKPETPDEIPFYKTALWNRMLGCQLEEMTHSVSCRPAWALMYETLDFEVLGMYNFTTEELFLKPKLTYDIADDLSFTIGGMLYSGPDETLFGMLDSRLSSVFTEIKVSF